MIGYTDTRYQSDPHNGRSQISFVFSDYSFYRMIYYIQQSCGLKAITTPTITYEDNAACVTQMEIGYIKSNINKHITPKLFYPHEL